MKPLLLAAVALVAPLTAACTPEQLAAVQAELNRRAEVRSHPFLACVRAHESDRAGGYLAQNRDSSASGAYQFLDSTWRTVAPQAGVTGYARAVHAPDWAQDHVALWAHTHPAAAGRPWAGTGC